MRKEAVMKRSRALMIAFALFAGSALAQPAVQQSHGVRWVSGGIGEDGRAELAELRPDFNLQLSFAVKREGSYLADVKVMVRDAAGRELIDAVSEGPWFFAQLPPGRYEVSATFHGVTHERAVVLREGGQRQVYLYWQEAAANG
jgi:hypothetical protein